MLKITVPASEFFDEIREEFITTKEQVLCLEHSLVSVSKWESKWKKPFLTNNEKTIDELVDYVRCMTLTQNVDPNVYLALSNDNFDQVTNYIKDSMTATTFNDNLKSKPKTSKEFMTSEIIYYYMISYNIPVEFQKWHLNRLITLIRVCQIKNQTSKMSKAEVAKQQRELNAARRKKLGTKG